MVAMEKTTFGINTVNIVIRNEFESRYNPLLYDLPLCESYNRYVTYCMCYRVRREHNNKPVRETMRGMKTNLARAGRY